MQSFLLYSGVKNGIARYVTRRPKNLLNMNTSKMQDVCIVAHMSGTELHGFT